MNSARAKTIRKETGFKVHKPREYYAITVRGKKGKSIIVTSETERQQYQKAKKQHKQKGQ
jgi:DNA-binding HxlR family transcriptional regulator